MNSWNKSSNQMEHPNLQQPQRHFMGQQQNLNEQRFNLRNNNYNRLPFPPPSFNNFQMRQNFPNMSPFNPPSLHFNQIYAQRNLTNPVQHSLNTGNTSPQIFEQRNNFNNLHRHQLDGPHLPQFMPQYNNQRNATDFNNASQFVNPVNNIRYRYMNMNSPMISFEQKTEDLKQQYADSMKDLVSKWLNTKTFKAPDTSKDGKKLKLHQYKLAVTSYLTNIEQLRMLNDELADSMEAENDQWEALLKNVTSIKETLAEQQTQLFNIEQISYIEILLKRRKKKRESLKKRKAKRNMTYVSKLANRIKLNEQIDDWQLKEQRKILEKKMIDNLKNEAGESLTEVKRKSHEATELITVLELLKQLRDIKKETAIFKGVLVTVKDDVSFNGDVDKVTRLLTNQKKIYADEERALRVLREEETEELNRKQTEERKKRKENRRSALGKVDPLYGYRYYWLQGEENVSGLIHVRNLWDMFLCQPNEPGGTRIPKAWIEPIQPSCDGWKKYFKSKPKRKADVLP